MYLLFNECILILWGIPAGFFVFFCVFFSKLQERLTEQLSVKFIP